MYRFILPTLALSLMAAPAYCGDVSVTLTGTVLSNSYSSGLFAGAAANDTATLTFDVNLPGMDLAPNQLTNFAIDLATFDLDINGSTGAALGGPTNLQIQNDFPAADGFRINMTQLATNHFFEAGFGALGTFFNGTTQIDQLAGTYDVAANLTSFGYTIQGQGGFMEIFPETLVIEVPQFVCVEITGTVLANSYTTGSFGGVAVNDTATMTFNVGTTGVPIAPGQLHNYPVDATSFNIDINGPTGAVLTGSPNFGIQNNFPVSDGVRNLGGSFAGGQNFMFEFGAGGSFFDSIEIDELYGNYDVAANLTSFTWFTFGAGGSMEIFPETMVIKVLPGTYPSLCNGDGGDQLGCTDCPCGNNAPIGTTGGCLNSASTSASLSANGSASVSVPSGSSYDLRFGLAGAPPLAFCILNSGDNVAPTNVGNPCFGLSSGVQAAQFDGLRCAVGNTLRHGGRSADGNGDVGVSNNPWGGEGAPTAGIAATSAFVAGQTRYFQVINRDDPMAVCTRGLNTSQAVEVTFTP